MTTTMLTSDYILGQRVLETMAPPVCHANSLVDNVVKVMSFRDNKADISYPNTDFFDIYNTKPRTDNLTYIDTKVKMLWEQLLFLSREATPDMAFAKDLKKAITQEMTKGLDKGIRLALRNLKNELVVREYSKCNSFLLLLDDSVSNSEFDLRFHICMLTLTSHWKTVLPNRADYFKHISKFTNQCFGETRAKQILFGLE